jgi:hypothetical protein
MKYREPGKNEMFQMSCLLLKSAKRIVYNTCTEWIQIEYENSHWNVNHCDEQMLGTQRKMGS